MTITPAQMQERVNYLGGSDAAGILGLSKWKTPLQVFMAKVYPAHDDSEHRIGGKNEPAYWGNILEDKVAEGFTAATGKKVQRVNETLVHPQHDFIRANIDRRVVGEDAILECKTATAYKARDWADEEIPQEYILQVMHYLAVTGKQTGYVACLIGGQKFVWKKIDRDEELIRTIVDAEVNFWNNFILPKVPPVVTGSERDSELLARLYPDSIPLVEAEFSPEIETLIEKRDGLKELIAQNEEKVTEIENRIKAELKDCESGTAGKYTVCWKSQTRRSIDSQKLKAEQPDIFLKYQKENSFRVLRFAKNKNNREEK